jgi:hypothetical protein
LDCNVYHEKPNSATANPTTSVPLTPSSSKKSLETTTKQTILSCPSTVVITGPVRDVTVIWTILYEDASMLDVAVTNNTEYNLDGSADTYATSGRSSDTKNIGRTNTTFHGTILHPKSNASTDPPPPCNAWLVACSPLAAATVPHMQKNTPVST